MKSVINDSLHGQACTFNCNIYTLVYIYIVENPWSVLFL